MTIMLRVEWTTPDDDLRQAARLEMERQAAGRLLDGLMISTRPGAERQAALADRFPDLEAVVTHFGTMLSNVYVPAQYTFVYGEAFNGGLSGVSKKTELSKARWVALVVTEHGTVEMDPTKLRVVGRCIAADRLCGRVGDP